VAGIYLHIPFCVHKCIYCDFFSVEDRRDEGRLVEALKAEIALVSGHAKRETVGTVYFGGGTPSLLEASVIEEILVLIRSIANVPPDAEITLEANPGTVDDTKLREFRRIGINRLSIGIQSFHDHLLKGLTRIHTDRKSVV
jgi:oxygen-independent coproporphyrinogen-3 oxidase